MRIAVLGATGRTGVLFVHAAVDAGHDVRALVRTPEKAQLLPGVEIVQGDALEKDAIARLVDGADAVVDLLAPDRRGPAEFRRLVTPSLVDEMAAQDVDRLLFLTGAGVRVEDDEPKLVDRLIVGVMRRVTAEVLQDAELAVETIRRSDLRWTVVRAPRLVDGPATGEARAQACVGKASGAKVTRADLAAFVLAETEEPRWVQRFPVVTA